MNWKCILKNAGILFGGISLLFGYIALAAYITTLGSLLLSIIGWSLIGLFVITVFIIAGMGICSEEGDLYN